MKSGIYNCLLFFTAILIFSGCATYSSQKVGPTPIEHAKVEIPENQLIDVGIVVFESEELTPKKAEEEERNKRKLSWLKREKKKKNERENRQKLQSWIKSTAPSAL